MRAAGERLQLRALRGWGGTRSLGPVEGDVGSTAEALAGEGEDGGRAELPGGGQDGMELSRLGCRQGTAVLAPPNGCWEAATTNPG